MGSVSDELVYSPAQVAEYLDYIGLPQSFHPSANPTLDLSYLTALFVHQITAIPYENLLIHYSPNHTVSLDPQTLFTKIITNRRGRGGYCMENALLFKHMLHALGFTNAYTVGVRIRTRIDGVPQGDFTGWVHLVIILTLPSSSTPQQRYALDVAFGGDGPTFPMPLTEGLVHHNSIGTQEIRYVRGFIPAQTFRGEGAARMWMYQYRNGKDKEWNTFYAFNAEFEFMEPDFRVMSHFTSTSEENPQGVTVLAILFLRGKGEDGRPTVRGKVMMVNGVVKRNLGGRTEVVRVCKTEGERVDALKEWFGIELTEEERESIRGRVSELRG
ncbi:arylamine N-acetyltransferase, pineal gland isozyme NAT-10 [Podospora aff. communis PSN243]|uniref:Arylamine N-acetyltransferase, pineal gland isozyme NAT-10 n=1 Tax=Podospora aff. communis PSN243 TaxID=3040156 RepID=A0AAV9GIC1_9PEZI|nr:arylamine N-acetyltransferase, pineal gland isozyme NAT-10 [Podospora aff. communis PSN243]